MNQPISIETLLELWEQARRKDALLTPESYCRQYPEYQEELIQRIQALLFIEGINSTRRDSCLSTSVQQESPQASSSLSSNRYRLIQLHAQGGLGEVYQAQDQQLSRVVALKRMRGKTWNDPHRRRRFLREAEITGRLDHPGIVAVHGLEVNAEGNPSYTMKFVTGQTLSEAIGAAFKQHVALPAQVLRELVTRFISVCNTVAYAHSKSVVHRDIKPANIMLGEFGATYVVDWGLAKHLTEEDVSDTENPSQATLDEELTRTGFVLGTPAYMSPEQAHGTPASFASDIYSLGATLYFMLTGQAPLTDLPEKPWFSRLQEGDIAAPGSIRKSIPRNLEAICVKAIAKSPEDRYPNALALAGDLEKWLADEPVSAITETWSQRLARWTRRHRAWAQASVVAILLVAVISTVFALMLDHQTGIARQERHNAINLASEKQQLAIQEGEARKLADERSQLALSTLKAVVTNIQRKLVQLPGSQDIRKDLLSTAIQGLAKVATSLNTRNEAIQSLAEAHAEIGKIYLLIGDVSSVKATEEALKHFTKAHEIIAQLCQTDSANMPLLRRLSISYEWIGDVQVQRAELDLAEKAYHQSLEISQLLYQRDETSLERLRDVAFGLEKLGDIQLNRSHVQPARESYTRSRELIRQALAQGPDNIELLRDLLVSCSKIGNVQAKEKQFAEAAQSYQESLSLIDRLEKLNQLASQSRDRSVILNKLGDVRQAQKQYSQAVEAFQAGLQIARKNVEKDPHNYQFQRDLSVSLNYLGGVHILQQQVEQARWYYLESLTIRRKLQAQDMSNMTARIDLAYVLSQLGDLKKSSEPKLSKKYYLEAHGLIQPLAEQKKLQASDHLELYDHIVKALKVSASP